MQVSIIAAIANNNVIGNENQLIWHMPADLKHFKALTMGHTMIMGRKTFESIGSPLKGRTTIVISRQKDYDARGCKVAASLEEALTIVKDEKEVFIAGGAQVYRQAIQMKRTRKMYLTRIFASFEGDAFFPEIDMAEWECTERTDHQPDDKNKYPYSFRIYRRKRHAD
jgi:dihydrofolate reductase